MKYTNMQKGIFVSRPNRFIAHVSISAGEDKEEIVVCHVKNTGRCKELLLPGVTVLVQFHPEAAALGRKTWYSLIGVLKEREDGPLLINMDSQAPNLAAFEWLTENMNFLPLPCDRGLTRDGRHGFTIETLKREVTYDQSRFDLAFKASDPSFSAFMEVKGVTLEEQGLAMFPDAPTERGIKHVDELIRAHKEGYESYLMFVIQMKGIRAFKPNIVTHPEFAKALLRAEKEGVHLLAYDCIITEDSMTLDQPVPILLE